MTGMLDHGGIRALLPQRYPMLLVDRIVEVRPDGGLTAIKAISATEPCYRASPPDDTYPVALLIESFGQAAAIAWLLWDKDDDPGRIASGRPLFPLFAGLRDVRISGTAHPGDVVRHEVRLDHVMDGAACASGRVLVGDRVIATVGELLAVIRPAAAIGPAPVGHGVG